MRVVIDTNVLISAALKEASLPAMAVHLVAHRCALLKSTVTEWELHDVLGRRKLAVLIPQASREWLTTMLATAELIAIHETITACRDPDDDKFLELAVNGHADIIVSGDADLLALNPFRAIQIVPPATFVQTAIP